MAVVEREGDKKEVGGGREGGKGQAWIINLRLGIQTPGGDNSRGAGRAGKGVELEFSQRINFAGTGGS